MQRRIATLERVQSRWSRLLAAAVFRKASAARSVWSIWVSQELLATIVVMGETFRRSTPITYIGGFQWELVYC